MHPRAIMLRYPFVGAYPVSFRFGVLPVDSKLKQKYQEWGLKGHHGIDFGLPLGTKVVAADSGKVIQVGDHKDFGISITLQHVWGSSFYAHLKETLVSLSQKVKVGQAIGLSGQSGFTTGPHLHFAIKPINADIQNGYLGYIDPLKYLPKFS